MNTKLLIGKPVWVRTKHWKGDCVFRGHFKLGRTWFFEFDRTWPDAERVYRFVMNESEILEVNYKPWTMASIRQTNMKAVGSSKDESQN